MVCNDAVIIDKCYFTLLKNAYVQINSRQLDLWQICCLITYLT